MDQVRSIVENTEYAAALCAYLSSAWKDAHWTGMERKAAEYVTHFYLTVGAMPDQRYVEGRFAGVSGKYVIGKVRVCINMRARRARLAEESHG
jgi:hypothetical protein